MSFELLKQVISHLKKKSFCAICKAKFTDASIFVLATNINIETGVAHGLFLIVCPKCSAQAFLMTELSSGTPPNMPIADESIRVSSKPASEVTTNDVLDMHNFLKNFQGDVRQLFNEL